MSYGQIDLATQVAQGLAFALDQKAGGTGRIDARAKGIVHQGMNDDPNGSTINAGALVTVRAGTAAGVSFGPSAIFGGQVRCQLPEANDMVIGIAMETAAVTSVSVSGAFDMLTFGYYASVLTTGTILHGDILYSSSTPGRATATRAFGSVPIGFALGDASGLSTCPIWFDTTPSAFALEHSVLISTPGIRRHTDLAEGTRDQDWTVYDTGNGDISALHDRSDSTYQETSNGPAFGPNRIDVDLGQGNDYRFKTSALRVLVSRNSGASTIASCLIQGSNNGSSYTTVSTFSLSMGASGSPIENIKTWIPNSTPYRYWRLEVPYHSSSTRWYNFELYEASGQYLYVQNPAGGTSLLDSAISGTNIGRGFYFMMGGN